MPMSSITGGKISPCWLGMFPSNAFGIQSADLFSAGAALLRHSSALELLKSSIASGQAKEKYCTSSSQVPAPLQLFQLVQKGKE